jgi:hypothetical protein
MLMYSMSVSVDGFIADREGDEVDLRGWCSNAWQTLVPELHRPIRDVGLC